MKNMKIDKIQDASYNTLNTLKNKILETFKLNKSASNC